MISFEREKSEEGTVYSILQDGKDVGMISQNPDDPAVADPGRWNAVIRTRDGGLAGLGFFDTEQEARAAACNALGW